MRSFLLGLAIVLGTLIADQAMASEFCDGYKVGYEAGRCYRRLVCVKLVEPICPPPRLGERTFQGGYNRGSFEGSKEVSAERGRPLDVGNSPLAA